MRYTIIGGINGVGKSTIYSVLSDEDVCGLGRRINVDEIASANGDWRNEIVQIKAGMQAVREIHTCLNEKITFHQETTLAGKTVLHTAKKAKAIGYSVHLWYIYVANTEIAKHRVYNRVKLGGHGVSDETIERRSVTSLKTLKSIIPLCSEVRLYDNTTSYNPVARRISGATKILDKNIPPHILACLE